MAGNLPGLEGLSPQAIGEAASYRYGIVTSLWNSDVTSRLKEGARSILSLCKVSSKHIYEIEVPGSFELPLGAQWLLEHKSVDAIVCLGCIIQGETRHDEYLAQAVSKGLMDLNIKYSKPVVFGVLTVHTLEQALDRAGGKWGNKGSEALIGAVQMLKLKKDLLHSGND